MSKFITRVELHNAVQSDYVQLHNLMEKAGFSRTIESDKGIKYSLPWAEYYCESNTTINNILSIAKNAASATGHTSAIIVGECTALTWSGLSVVK